MLCKNLAVIPADQIQPSRIYKEALSQAWHLFDPVMSVTVPTKYSFIFRPRLVCREISEGYFVGGLELLRSKQLDSKAKTGEVDLIQTPDMSDEEMHYWMLQDICNSFNLINFVSSSPSDVGYFLKCLMKDYPNELKLLIGTNSKKGLSERFGCSKNTLFPTEKSSTRKKERAKLDPSLFGYTNSTRGES